MNLHITLPIETSLLVAEISNQKDAIEFILAVDLARADAGFTEDLIKRLTASLRNDLTPAEFQDMLAELAKEKAP